MFMFKLDSGQLPEVFNKLFIKNINIHQYETRQSTLLHVQKARITLYQKSLKYTGVSAWNYVKNKLNVNCSFYLFKRNLKSFLLFNDVSILPIHEWLHYIILKVIMIVCLFLLCLKIPHLLYDMLLNPTLN